MLWWDLNDDLTDFHNLPVIASECISHEEKVRPIDFFIRAAVTRADVEEKSAETVGFFEGEGLSDSFTSSAKEDEFLSIGSEVLV